MQSIAVKNLSKGVISVVMDDNTIFSDILPGAYTFFCPADVGSTRLLVLDQREKPVQDLWVSIAPSSRHILYVLDSSSLFVTLSDF